MKLKHDKLVSKIAFNCNLRHYDVVARREPGVVSNSFHPGSVATNLTRSVLPGLALENVTEKKVADNSKTLARLSIRNADEGAKTHVWLSTAAEAVGRCTFTLA